MSHHAPGTPWQCSSFNYPRKLQNEIFDIDIKSDLTVSSSPKIKGWDCSEGNLTMIPI
jgi:hypothetical protein